MKSEQGKRTALFNRFAVIIIALLGTWSPNAVFGQSSPGIELDLIEIWIRGKVSPERAWNRDLSQAGVAFQMSDQIEARLREAGADGRWIEYLRKAAYNPPPTARPAEVDVRYSRNELRPLYFGNAGTITPYASVMRLEQSGGQVPRRTIQTLRGSAVLRDVPLPELIPAYGVVFNLQDIGLDIETAFPEDLFLLNFGLKITPFLPLGQTGLRLTTGVKPFVGFAQQTLTKFPNSSPDEKDNEVSLVNYVWGGDANIGLAYHWKPGSWIFAELVYRYTGTFGRSLNMPDTETNVTEGIDWTKWGARGPMLRMGIGF